MEKQLASTGIPWTSDRGAARRTGANPKYCVATKRRTAYESVALWLERDLL